MRPTIALIAALAVTAAVPAASEAASVSPQGLDNAELRFEAAPGESNSVVVAGNDGQVVSIRDSVPITVPATARTMCVSVSAVEVRCTNRSAWGRLIISTGDGADSITGSAAGETFHPGVGDDTVIGGGGADRYEMSGAPDGADRIAGGAGDVVSYAARVNPVRIALGGPSPVSGEAGEGDVIQGVRRAEGGAGADTLTGTRFADALDGGAGRDRFAAGGGNDRISARDAVPDVVDCGRGRRDVVDDDRRGEVSLARCERRLSRARR
jgi:hypothetical protein